MPSVAKAGTLSMSRVLSMPATGLSVTGLSVTGLPVTGRSR